jgi:S-DNA-T family DNA segregation ATPase FtsK/SpoIIIE
MERSNIWRPIVLFLALASWVFLLFALGSFHTTDWPSHQVYPYGAIKNLCGSVGSFVAYYAFLAMGQGVFPILFFSGVCLALFLFHSKVSDMWLRVAGLLLVSVAFAAAVHNIRPGSHNGFPEGHGGIVGIGTATFLHSHFNTVGTWLILLTTFFVGLLLVADDLVLRTPALVGQAMNTVKERAPGVKWNMPSLAEMPVLKKLFTPRTPEEIAAAEQRAKEKLAAKAQETMNRAKTAPGAMNSAANQAISAVASRRADEDEIDLSYANDEPAAAAVETVHADDADPAPAEAVMIPPIEMMPIEVAATPGDLSDIEGASAPSSAGDERGAVGDGEMAALATAAVPPAPPLRTDIIVKLPSMQKPRPAMSPPPPPRELGEYQLPGWDYLENAEHGFAESQEAFVREKAAILEQALKEFSIDASVVEIDTGPVITMYEISLAPGIKVSQITALSNDIARALMAISVRIVAPVPGKNTVGIEVPNAQKEKVRFKELMQLEPEASHKMAIPLFLGKDASGEALVTDLAAMPHCLIAGTTGSGKSVCINTIIMSIMYLQRPDAVKLILIDPKVVEMAPFKDIPHLMCPVINDCGRATSVLEWACEKMDERYEFLAEAGVRNIKGYNSLTREELMERFQPSSPEEEAKIPKHLPYIVIIVDELADLMMTSGKEVESFIVRLAQKSRAVGIHLVLATQRPSANVVTGLIKSNMPSRIAFRVQSKMDSRIVLDQNGADLLLGQGDMLFMPPGASKPIRSQGTFIDDKEIRESVKLVRGLAEAQYEPELVQIKGQVGDMSELEQDDLFDDAVRVVLETKRGSVSLLQRRLTIGYGRASRLIEMMAAAGIVGEYKGSQAREAMITIEEWEAMQAARQTDKESGMSV